MVAAAGWHMAAPAAKAWAGAASRGAGRARVNRLRLVTSLLFFVVALIAAPDAAAEEPAASSSMLRRRQVDDSASVAAGAGAADGPAAEDVPVLGMDAVAAGMEAAVASNGAVAEEASLFGMDDLDLWRQGQAAAFEEGDKGWFTGAGGGAQWPKCAWAGTLTRNISNIFALCVILCIYICLCVSPPTITPTPRSA